jgi:ketosteroid isomerase-like protein
MNSRRGYLCLVLAFLVVLLPACRKIGPTAEPEILAVMQAAQDGWNQGDLDAYMQCYWHSPRLRFAGRDEVSCGWEAVLAGYRRAYPDRSAMGQLHFADLDVTVIDPDNALVFGRWRLERAGDQPHGLFTLHLKKFAGQWLIVSDHTSSGDPDRSAAEATITACDLLERVTFLSSREMAGRLPGTPQFAAAARAMASRFAELGLVPGGEDGFFQHLPIESNPVWRCWHPEKPTGNMSWTGTTFSGASPAAAR